MRVRMQRLLVAALSVAAVSALLVPSVAQAQWTGSDYCAVQNSKGDWSLVGGASCNPNPGQSENSSWSQAFILDFDALQVINANDPADVETFGTLYAMLADLSENHASEGWMYVANEQGQSGRYVFLMVNRASCAGNSQWAIAPACDTPASPAAATAATAVVATPAVTG